jgi:hypothetical protein
MDIHLRYESVKYSRSDNITISKYNRVLCYMQELHAQPEIK